MSLKPITLDSVDAKAARVLSAHGRAPNMLRSFDDAERASLAALVGADGTLIDGAAAGFREVLVAYNDRLKATDADLEGETVSVYEPEGASAVARSAEPVQAPEESEDDE